MTPLPQALRLLIESGPLAHLSTTNADGSPQVTVIWIGLDGDEIVRGHLARQRKLDNIARDPRVVLSLAGERDHDAVLSPYAVLRCTATFAPGDAWGLLDRLAKVYMRPDSTFPAPQRPGFVTRYSVERISGVGPWVPTSRG